MVVGASDVMVHIEHSCELLGAPKSLHGNPSSQHPRNRLYVRWGQVMRSDKVTSMSPNTVGLVSSQAGETGHRHTQRDDLMGEAHGGLCAQERGVRRGTPADTLLVALQPPDRETGSVAEAARLRSVSPHPPPTGPLRPRAPSTVPGAEQPQDQLGTRPLPIPSGILSVLPAAQPRLLVSFRTSARSPVDKGPRPVLRGRAGALL